MSMYLTYLRVRLSILILEAQNKNLKHHLDLHSVCEMKKKKKTKN